MRMRPVHEKAYEQGRKVADLLEAKNAQNPFLADGDDAADLLREDLQPPPYLVEDIIYSGTAAEGGTIAFLGGNPNIGKTYAALHMMVSVSQGLPWFGFLTEPGPCGGIFLETPRWVLQERLRAIIETIPGDSWFRGCLYLKTAADLGMDSIDVCDPTQQDWIIDYVSSRGLCLLVIDPFAFLHRLNEKDTGDAVRIGDALKRIARETGTALLILDHFRKMAPGGGSEDVLQALRGAIAKSAFAGAVMGLDERHGTLRLRFGKVASRKSPGSVYLRRGDNGELHLTEAPEDRSKSKARRLHHLNELLSRGPQTLGELEKALEAIGIPVKADTIRKRYLPELGAHKTGGSKNSRYVLPDKGPCPGGVRESGQLPIE